MTPLSSPQPTYVSEYGAVAEWCSQREKKISQRETCPSATFCTDLREMFVDWII